MIKSKDKALKKKDDITNLLTTLHNEFNALNLWLKELVKSDDLTERDLKVFEEFISDSKKRLKHMNLGLKVLEETLTFHIGENP